MTTYISIVIAIIAFSVIVLAHELGHLLAAKKNGIYVLEFAIGMGPKLFSKQFGETIYSIRAFPIGGFCKMLGEDEECTDPRAFGAKGPLAKFTVIVAGAIMNFILGIILIFVVVLATGYTTTVVNTASESQPAYKAGIREGDEILSINGRKTLVFEDILFSMNTVKSETVRVETLSNGQIKTYDIVPEVLTTKYSGKTYTRKIIGVSPISYAGILSGETNGLPRAEMLGSIENTFLQFRFYIMATFDSLRMLLTAQVSPSELSGFLGIGGAFVESIEEPIKATGEDGAQIPLSTRVKAAVLNVLSITILITINLGIMNLLPFPALDGGRAVFIIIEGIRKKPLDQDKEGVIHFAGFVLLMLLMVFVTYNDILKLFGNG